MENVRNLNAKHLYKLLARESAGEKTTYSTIIIMGRAPLSIKEKLDILSPYHHSETVKATAKFFV